MGNKESKPPDRRSENEEITKNDVKKRHGVSKAREFIEPADDNKNSENKHKKQAADDKPVDEQTRLAFEDWLYQRLTKYFEDIQEKVLKVKFDKNERNDIGAAAEEFLDFLFSATEVVDRRFRINSKHVIKVGAFYENLDVVHIDELKYCIVIDELSQDSIHKIVREVKENDEFHKIYLKESSALRWEECVMDEGEDQHWLRSDIGLATTFFDRVAKAVEKVREKSRATIFRKHGRLDLLEVNGVTKRGVSVQLKFTWNTDTVVTVVLTPCLMYDKILEFIDEECTLGKLAHKVLRSGGHLLLQPVPDTDEYFQWQFSHAERDYLKSYVSNNHKRVYQMIKFLVQGYNRNMVEEAEFFNEQAIKTLVFIHDRNCEANDRFADCVMGVIEDMRNLMKVFRDKIAPIFLHSCFNKYQNVINEPCREYRREMIDVNLTALEQIANHLINDIGCTALYDFNTSIKTLVPLNQFILKKDYRARKNGTDAYAEDSLDSKKALIDAVSNKKFTVKF